MPKRKLKPCSTNENGDREKAIPVRKLKIYYGSHQSNNYSRYPLIRIAGNYLQSCGFKIGDTIEVRLSKDRIEISKVGKE